MATQTPSRVVERPLDLVLAPSSPAEAAYRSVVLAPGFREEPGLGLRYLGGKTIPALTFMDVYLGRWNAAERTTIDTVYAAAVAISCVPAWRNAASRAASRRSANTAAAVSSTPAPGPAIVSGAAR